MAYIVDLIIIIRTIVVISEARHKFVWPEEIEDVLRRFEANQRNEIHAEIRSFVQEMGVLQAIAGPKAIVLEKMVELVDSRGASAEDSST
jgi:hypothetical protein